MPSYRHGSVLHFNPRLPRGRRHLCELLPSDLLHFNPRLPRGRRRPAGTPRSTSPSFQSTPPSREATRGYGLPHRAAGISIHASLAGGDRHRRCQDLSGAISIHASLAGGDGERGVDVAEGLYFNPRLPRGRRPGRDEINSIFALISIHASLAGGDISRRMWGCSAAYFNPRLPRGRRLQTLQSIFWHIRFQSTPPSREATQDQSFCQMPP
mgnify:CR=1 FL=1